MWLTRGVSVGSIRTMNLKQTRFVQEYCVDFNATQAAIRAGYSEDAPGQVGHVLLKNAEVAAAIEERMDEIATAAGITTEAVLKKWWDIANADPSEISQVRRVNCRHCYGVLHAYQWTEAEYTAAVTRAVNTGQAAPDGLGGFSFVPNADPNPACPECGGDGEEDVYVADTRRLKGRARKLFAGAERTKSGIKITLRDQDAALNNLARCLGMLKDNVNLTGQLEFKPLSEFYGSASPEPSEG